MQTKGILHIDLIYHLYWLFRCTRELVYVLPLELPIHFVSFLTVPHTVRYMKDVN